MQVLRGIDPRWYVVPVRVVMGLILIWAGFTKLSNLGGTAGFFGQVGIPAPEVTAALIGGLELVGGIMLLVGFATRWIALAFVLQFLIIAFVITMPRSGWNAARIDLMMLAGALTLAMAGAGAASVDETMARKRAGVAR